MITYIQKDIKNIKLSNKSTNHFENDLDAYLPLNNVSAIFFISFLILLLPIFYMLFIFFFTNQKSIITLCNYIIVETLYYDFTF